MNSDSQNALLIIEQAMNPADEESLLRLQEQLATAIDCLVSHDFSRLVSLLYRIDVDEKAVKRMLKENPGVNAGQLIAPLVIQRQLQKIKSRRQNQRDSTIPGEEGW